MSARYEDALFMQTEQLRFLNSTYGVRYMEIFDRSMRQKSYEDDRYHELPDNWTWTITRTTLEGADPIYISKQVAEMIDYAQESFQPEEVLATDLFTAQGFAFFPAPIWLPDAQGRRMPIRAVAWMPIRGSLEDGMEAGGVWCTFFTHRDDDELAVDFADEMELKREFRKIPFATLTVAHSFWLGYGIRGWENIPDPAFSEVSRRQWGLVQTLWRIGSQIVRTVKVAPRHVRKDAKRHGLDRENVTVITLRKLAHDVIDPSFNDSEGDGRHYTVQFLVRGHWRNAWYPSLQEHRQIWIMPHVKGPEDAPFRPTQRVFELVR